jgi:methionyl aminopeptidase
MGFRKKERVQIKTPEQIELMRVAGKVVADTLQTLRASVTPGITTRELDAVARECIYGAGATPSFLGYYGFPAVICTSINEEVVHGIPGDRVVNEGDLVSIDCGAIVDGWHGDAAISVIASTNPQPSIQKLSDVTRASLAAGIEAAVAGNRMGDIGSAIEAVIRGAGNYGIVEDYVGHGIGTEMHMYPPVPNYGHAGQGLELKVGMVLALEPMVTIGSPEVMTLADDWTVVTSDGNWASHWEHTVAITESGPQILTINTHN